MVSTNNNTLVTQRLPPPAPRFVRFRFKVPAQRRPSDVQHHGGQLCHGEIAGAVVLCRDTCASARRLFPWPFTDTAVREDHTSCPFSCDVSSDLVPFASESCVRLTFYMNVSRYTFPSYGERSVGLTRATRLTVEFLSIHHSYIRAFCYALSPADAQNHARVLSSSCGDFYHSESEDRHGYGENLYLCWGTGSGSCYTPEKAMTGLCELYALHLRVTRSIFIS